MRKREIKMNISFDLSKEPPLFNRGMLIYEKSGHKLTNIGKYFTCAEKQKGKCCDEDEKDIEIEKIENNFSERLQNLELSADKIKIILEEIQRESLCFKEEIRKIIDKQRCLLNNTIVAMHKEISKGKNINKNDIADFRVYFLKIMELSHPLFFLKHLVDVLKRLQLFEKTAEIDDFPARELMIKKIYLTNNCEIAKIELEGLGDYLFQKIDSLIPGFTEMLKIPIIKRLSFSSLNTGNFLESLTSDRFGDFLSYTNLSSSYKEEKFIQGLFKGVNKYKPLDVVKFGVLLKDEFWIDPLFHFAPIHVIAGDGRKTRHLYNFR